MDNFIRYYNDYVYKYKFLKNSKYHIFFWCIYELQNNIV